MVLRKLDIHTQKNEIAPLSYTLCKNQLKMNSRQENKQWNEKATYEMVENIRKPYT